MALFATSCFWQPVPTDVLLSYHTDLVNSTSPIHLLKDLNVQPLVDLVNDYHSNINITTNGTTPPDLQPTATTAIPSRPLTTLLPRCWCDLPFSWLTYDTATIIRERRREASSTPSQLAVTQRKHNLFEPFDTKEWEEMSLVKHAREVRRQRELLSDRHNSTVLVESTSAPRHAGKEPSETKQPGATETFRRVWRAVAPIFSRRGRREVGDTSSVLPSLAPTPTPTVVAPQEPLMIKEEFDYSITLSVWRFIPFKVFWRGAWQSLVEASSERYDLSSYGLGVYMDFGWSYQRT